jgi:site-specific recombinase XerD
MTSIKRRWTVTSDKFLTKEQVDQLVDHLMAKRDLAIARNNNVQAVKDFYIVRTLLESGLRVFEFCALINSDLQGHRLNVRHGKGDKPRTVLLTRTALLLLKEWLEIKNKLGHSTDPQAPMFESRFKKAYTTRGIQKRIKIAFKAVGLPTKLSVHSLRHTYCSFLLASGKVGIATVKENLGHHSIAVTNLYAHAVGDLTHIELYQTPSSHNSVLSELQSTSDLKKPNNIVKTFLRKANFK